MISGNQKLDDFIANQSDNINGMITLSKLLKIWNSSFLVTIFNHLGVWKEQRDNKCAWVLIKLQWLFTSIKWNAKTVALNWKKLKFTC